MSAAAAVSFPTVTGHFGSQNLNLRVSEMPKNTLHTQRLVLLRIKFLQEFQECTLPEILFHTNFELQLVPIIHVWLTGYVSNGKKEYHQIGSSPHVRSKFKNL